MPTSTFCSGTLEFLCFRVMSQVKGYRVQAGSVEICTKIILRIFRLNLTVLATYCASIVREVIKSFTFELGPKNMT